MQKLSDLLFRSSTTFWMSRQILPSWVKQREKTAQTTSPLTFHCWGWKNPGNWRKNYGMTLMRLFPFSTKKRIISGNWPIWLYAERNNEAAEYD